MFVDKRFWAGQSILCNFKVHSPKNLYMTTDKATKRIINLGFNFKVDLSTKKALILYEPGKNQNRGGCIIEGN
jgi:hypothetical protein